MKPLKEIIPNTCFVSCVKIVGQDLGFDLDIKAFIERFHELCHKGTKIEGAFFVTEENVAIISGKMGFSAVLTKTLRESYDEDDCRAILSFHRFNGEEGHAHCLVYCGCSKDGLSIETICPSLNAPFTFLASDLPKWQTNIVEIRNSP
ncbi:MAG TPA: hypothetical protein VHH73_01925 [Verrucomicrobiae bacterium]|nr:hypothetical protein [Verrucomicrobiae bacterium]